MAGLPMWTIYDHPADYPGHFVVRCYLVETGRQTTYTVMLADSLDEARSLVPADLYCTPRAPSDDPVIVETWF